MFNTLTQHRWPFNSAVQGDKRCRYAAERHRAKTLATSSVTSKVNPGRQYQAAATRVLTSGQSSFDSVKPGIPLYTPFDLTGVCCQTGLEYLRLDRCEGQVLVVSGQIVGYVRVSAADQNPQRQLEVLGECHKIFTDKISGKSRAKRQALAELLGYIRDDDTVRI